MNTILIVEDHAIMRKGLSDFLTETGRWQVLGEAASLEEAKSLLSTTAPPQADILLLDIDLQKTSGFDIIPWLRLQKTKGSACKKRRAEIPAIVVYSAFDDYAHIQAAFKLGARGYVCKSQSEAELEAALTAVLDGGTYLCESLQTKILVATETLELLTKREQQIFTLVRAGRSNRSIAKQLEISVRTVENHLSCIYGKTGLTRASLQKL
jgi:DNA-binding NarL/FixJ family response regulator